jgi:hypothetical protein
MNNISLRAQDIRKTKILVPDTVNGRKVIQILFKTSTIIVRFKLFNEASKGR